jgi:hypothetical protein
MIKPESVFTLHDGFDLFPIGEPSQYPCYLTTGSDPSKVPTYEPGSVQSIGLQGSATHGGGSCQISITYDNPPNANSVFKVLKSFMGGCPITADGNLTPNPVNVLPELPYTIPSFLPAGDAVIAWTWFNKIGNREMYMRCAPIKISGSNKDVNDFNRLPDIFTANIGGACTTVENLNAKFPNPGSEVVGTGDDGSLANCGTSTPPPEDVPESEPTPTTYTPPPVLIATPTPTPTPTYEDPKENSKDDPKDDHPQKGKKCTDGEIICTSATTWSLCVYGELTPMGSTAGGLKCEDGEMALVKRNLRFSHEHSRLRRHHATL